MCQCSVKYVSLLPFLIDWTLDYILWALRIFWASEQLDRNTFYPLHPDLFCCLISGGNSSWCGCWQVCVKGSVCWMQVPCDLFSFHVCQINWCNTLSLSLCFHSCFRLVFFVRFFANPVGTWPSKCSSGVSELQAEMTSRSLPNAIFM